MLQRFIEPFGRSTSTDQSLQKLSLQTNSALSLSVGLPAGCFAWRESTDSSCSLVHQLCLNQWQKAWAHRLVVLIALGIIFFFLRWVGWLQTIGFLLFIRRSTACLLFTDSAALSINCGNLTKAKLVDASCLPSNRFAWIKFVYVDDFVMGFTALWALTLALDDWSKV